MKIWRDIWHRERRYRQSMGSVFSGDLALAKGLAVFTDAAVNRRA